MSELNAEPETVSSSDSIVPPEPSGTYCLIVHLKAALEAKREHVRECEADLAAARADCESFATQIASELGIAPKPENRNDVLVKAKQRREQVLVLYQEGKTVNQIAETLGWTRDYIDKDLMRLRKKGRLNKTVFTGTSSPETKEPVKASRPTIGIESLTRMEKQVYEFARWDMKASAIANRLQTSSEAIYQHLSQIRKKGLLLSKQDEPGEETDEPAEETGEMSHPIGVSEEIADPELVTDLTALKLEVTRQQAGIRGKAVRFDTSMTKSHRHEVRVDRMGDGQTIVDDSGHCHRCYRFVLSLAQPDGAKVGERLLDGHTHQLTIQSSEQKGSQ
jgi:DNA-binding NarL/FixJ family response regulator